MTRAEIGELAPKAAAERASNRAMRVRFATWLGAFALLIGCGGEGPAQRFEVAAPPTPPTPPTPLTPAPSASVAARIEAATGCFAPLAADKPIDQAKLEEVEAKTGPAAEKTYELGRVYFAAQHYTEAGPKFRTVAFQYPDSSVGIYGAELYLECLNRVGIKASQRPCYDELARDIAPLIELYCGKRLSAHESSCHLFVQIQLDLERRTDEQLVAVADQSRDASAYRAAAEAFSRTLHERCMPAPESSRCDEIAFNGAMAYLAAGDAASAKSALAVMRDPKNRMNRSALVTRLACRLDPNSSPQCPRITPP
jgi:hypothetical protein